MFSDDPQTEIMDLKRQVDILREKLEGEETKVIKRDQSNGALMMDNNDLQDEVDDLKKQLQVASNAHGEKSISNVDLTRKIRTLGMEKTALEAQVGRLTNEASGTWQEGLVKFLDDLVQKKLTERWEGLEDAYCSGRD